MQKKSGNGLIAILRSDGVLASAGYWACCCFGRDGVERAVLKTVL